MRNYDVLLADAAQLPVDERIQLIETLWDTVPEGALPSLSPEWLAEIEKRSADYDAGFVTAVPWQEVRVVALRRLERKGH